MSRALLHNTTHDLVEHHQPQIEQASGRVAADTHLSLSTTKRGGWVAAGHVPLACRWHFLLVYSYPSCEMHEQKWDDFLNSVWKRGGHNKSNEMRPAKDLYWRPRPFPRNTWFWSRRRLLREMAGPSAQVEMIAWKSRLVPTSPRGQACVRFVVCRLFLLLCARIVLLRLSRWLVIHATQRGRDGAASMLPLLF
jgi:hypothetical protein